MHFVWDLGGVLGSWRRLPELPEFALILYNMHYVIGIMHIKSIMSANHIKFGQFRAGQARVHWDLFSVEMDLGWRVDWG